MTQPDDNTVREIKEPDQPQETPSVVPVKQFLREIFNLPNSLTLFRIFLVPFLVVVLLTRNGATGRTGRGEVANREDSREARTAG